MADRLTMPKAKQAIARERKLFSEIRQLKTFGVQQRPGWVSSIRCTRVLGRH